VSAILLQHLAALAVGFGVTVLLIPWVIRFAHRHQVLDQPDGERRLHISPVPRLGGVAIFAGTLAGGAVLVAFSFLRGAGSLPYSPLLPGIVAGATIIFVTGLVDDLRGLSPRSKLLAQSLAATCVLAFGFRVETIALTSTGAALSLGMFSIPVTLLWLVGMTNAFNLIDGADGLAGTFALIALATTIGVGLYLHDPGSLVIAVPMLGAVFAFLRYNNSPAKIFLGDSGSMTLGLILAIELVLTSTTESGRTHVLVPLFALAFPLADTTIAVARRWLRGHPLSRADGRHIHHQVLALGMPTRVTVDLLGIFFSGVAALGLSISFAPPEFTLAFMVTTSVVLFAAFFYGSRWLRYGEFAELGRSVTSVFRNARTVVREKIRANDLAAEIRAATTFEQVRFILDAVVDDLRILDVELVAGDVHAHGPERQRISPPDQLPIRLDYPFTWQTEAGMHEMILRVWSERPSRANHPSTERVVMRIGPALEDWFRARGHELAPGFGRDAPPLSRRTPVAGIRRPEG
jgi:UDP-GlcNAc:undecaprenyl-phosphate GlcNAc-1-phosphate transferase